MCSSNRSWQGNMQLYSNRSPCANALNMRCIYAVVASAHFHSFSTTKKKTIKNTFMTMGKHKTKAGGRAGLTRHMLQRRFNASASHLQWVYHCAQCRLQRVDFTFGFCQNTATLLAACFSYFQAPPDSNVKGPPLLLYYA